MILDMINSYNHLLLYDQKESLLLKVINLPLMFYDYYQRTLPVIVTLFNYL